MTLQAQLEALRDNTLKEIAQVATLKELNQIRVETLGKKGPITEVLRGMKNLSPEERPVVGGFANEIRDLLTEAIEARKVVLENEALNAALKEESLDVTLPGKQMPQGTRHILTQVMEEIEDIFLGMGYQVVEGYEVESDHYNFERMNLPKNHPARDMQDTFYISDEMLIRTHTSPVQARTMEKHDFSKGALEVMMKKMFGEDRKIRLRPSYFPFTEPSVEVDVSCFKCGGAGCNVCKHTGWIEILGAGMVHPDVLQMSGIDPTEYSGFAFGLGPDRVAMLRYGVNDIRNFYQNDLRFLNQFKVKE